MTFEVTVRCRLCCLICSSIQMLFADCVVTVRCLISGIQDFCKPVNSFVIARSCQIVSCPRRNHWTMGATAEAIEKRAGPQRQARTMGRGPGRQSRSRRDHRGNHFDRHVFEASTSFCYYTFPSMAFVLNTHIVSVCDQVDFLRSLYVADCVV